MTDAHAPRIADPRIAAGMTSLLELRRRRLDAGERHLGWKLGFGAPAAAARLELDRPLVGFLTDRGLLPAGASVPVGSWTAPALEPEIAVVLARDLSAVPDRDDVRAAIGGLAAAIELADIDPPPEDPEAILAGDIYHRHVMLGPVRKGADPAAVRARVLRDGEEAAAADDPQAATGELLEILRLTAETLAGCGERLRTGDVVITGSATPPLTVAPGQAIEVQLPPLGSLRVTLT